MHHLPYRAILLNHPRLLGALFLAAVGLPFFLLVDINLPSDATAGPANQFSEATAFFDPVFLPLAAAVLFVGLLLYLVLWAQNYKFTLSEVSFEKEYGIISKDYVSIPYHHIQNVNIKRSLLERVLGIATVEIETAGNATSGAEGVLPGVSRCVAHDLQDELLVRAGERYS